MYVGDSDLSALDDRGLTVLRRARIGFVFQAYDLAPTLTARANITLPMRLAGRRSDEAWVDQVVRTLDIADRLDHRPSELSGGQQQRVAVVRALASQPEIIFADEPTGDLDSRSSAEVLRFLRQAVDELGQTIVMVTHDPVAASSADRILFLADGLVVDRMAAPTPERVLERMKQFGQRAAVLWTTLQGIVAHRLRLLATALAITLGVALLAQAADPLRHWRPVPPVASAR